jgi:hypothetical protein
MWNARLMGAHADASGGPKPRLDSTQPIPTLSVLRDILTLAEDPATAGLRGGVAMYAARRQPRIGIQGARCFSFHFARAGFETDSRP